MQLQSESWKNPVVVEYTARDAHQQNSLEEVAFAALANKAQATMHHVNLPRRCVITCLVKFLLQLHCLIG